MKNFSHLYLCSTKLFPHFPIKFFVLISYTEKLENIMGESYILVTIHNSKMF